MQFEFVREGAQVQFLLRDVDPLLDPIMEMCFWSRDDLGWRRPFPADARHLDKAMACLRRHGQAMFEQLAYLRPVPWKEALLAFAERANRAGLFWWLTGSCSACIRGFALNPHDVDIMFDSKDADALADLFQDQLIHPIVDTGGWLTKDFGVLFWHARIDLASDPAAMLDDPEPIDCGPFARQNLQTVMFEGLEIRVPQIELLIAANRRRGRMDRVAVLEGRPA